MLLAKEIIQVCSAFWPWALALLIFFLLGSCWAETIKEKGNK